MSQNRRIQKVCSLLKKELSLILNNDLSEEIISDNFISISKIEISPDLYYCKIYITSSVGDEKKVKIVDSLNNSKSFIRHKLTQRIQMRRIPELTFKMDRALEKGLTVLKLLDKLRDQKNNLEI
tara:strand:- start:759 stop:1130 length:372 start_codon:yes stop_codon:yes gene_type:complete